MLSRNLVRCYTSIKQKHGLCGGMEGDTEMCELVFKNIICNGFYCRWDLHCLLSSRSVFFQLAKQRISCLSNLQYSWPPYISMLLKYQGTNDMWHQWKTRKLRPTFLACLLLLCPLEEQAVNELSCCNSTSPKFWILLYVRDLINAWLCAELLRIHSLPPSSVGFVYWGVTNPASIHFY